MTQLNKAFKSFHGSIICLLETHIQRANGSSIQSTLFPAWHCIDNYVHANLGRIWLLHDDRVKIQVYRVTVQSIHCHIFSHIIQKYFFMAVLYVSNNYLVRRSLWSDLVEVSSHTSSVPQLVVEDFNVTLHIRDMSDYFLAMPLFRKELDFMDCNELTGLTDIQSSGAYYTWSNKRVVGFLAKKLDMVLGNDK